MSHINFKASFDSAAQGQQSMQEVIDQICHFYDDKKTASGIIVDLLTQTDQNGQSSFHKVCCNGKIDILRELVSAFHMHNPNVQQSKKESILYYLSLADMKGMQPIHLAAERQSSDIIKYLIDTIGINVNTSSDDGNTILHYISGAGQCQCSMDSRLQALNDCLKFQGLEIINAQNMIGRTPLHTITSSLECCEDFVKLLLERGADPLLCDANKATPIHFALTNPCDSPQKKDRFLKVLFLHAGPNLTLSIKQDLYNFGRANRSRVLQSILVALRRDVEMQPTNTTLVNSSISQTASQSDRAQPMNLLQPINENECVEKFNQAIDANKMNNMRELFDEILKYGEEGSMLVCNVIIAHTNEKGQNAFHKVCCNSVTLPMLRLLCEYYAKCNEQHLMPLGSLASNLMMYDKEGLQPIHIAANHLLIETIQFLVSCGVDSKQVDKRNNTIVHYLCGVSETTCSILDRLKALDELQEVTPSLINAVNDEQQSPLHLAVMSGSVALIDKLLTLGADVMLGYKSETTFQTPVELAFVRWSNSNIPALLLSHATGSNEDRNIFAVELCNKLRRLKIPFQSFRPQLSAWKDNSNVTVSIEPPPPKKLRTEESTFSVREGVAICDGIPMEADHNPLPLTSSSITNQITTNITSQHANITQDIGNMNHTQDVNTIIDSPKLNHDSDCFVTNMEIDHTQKVTVNFAADGSNVRNTDNVMGTKNRKLRATTPQNNIYNDHEGIVEQTSDNSKGSSTVTTSASAINNIRYDIVTAAGNEMVNLNSEEQVIERHQADDESPTKPTILKTNISHLQGNLLSTVDVNSNVQQSCRSIPSQAAINKEFSEGLRLLFRQHLNNLTLTFEDAVTCFYREIVAHHAYLEAQVGKPRTLSIDTTIEESTQTCLSSSSSNVDMHTTINASFLNQSGNFTNNETKPTVSATPSKLKTKQKQEHLQNSLLQSIVEGNLQKLQQLVNEHYACDHRARMLTDTRLDNEAKRALHYAAIYNHLDIIKYLIEEIKVTIATRDINGHMAIHDAVVNNAGDAVKYILATRKNDWRGLYQDPNYLNPCQLAAYLGKVHMLELFIEREPDCQYLQTESREKELLIHLAARANSAECLQLLLRSATNNINSKTTALKQTALHIAAANGHIAAARELLKHTDISVDVMDKSGKTPLELAKQAGHKDIVNLIEGL